MSMADGLDEIDGTLGHINDTLGVIEGHLATLSHTERVTTDVSGIEFQLCGINHGLGELIRLKKMKMEHIGVKFPSNKEKIRRRRHQKKHKKNNNNNDDDIEDDDE